MILSKGLVRLGGVVALAALLLSAGIASAPAAHAQGAPEILYGPAASADSVVAALVNGEECKSTTAVATDGYDSGFGWTIQIDPDECEASAGDVITFTVDGEAANEEVTWTGGVTEVTLTVTPMDDGMDDGDDGMDDGDDSMPVEPPDTGSAGLAATSSSSHALALGLGALAVAMLAGGRSVTGRSR